ncbi:MAG: N-acetylmuramoyl-L-alanine amidase [Paraclostridium sp.]
MKAICSVGHSILKSGVITSANGAVNEYEWCKKFVPMVVKVLNYQDGHSATLLQCPEKQFTKSLQERDYKLNQINNKGYDLVLEFHLNAHNGSAFGTETYYYTGDSKGEAMAVRVNKQLSTVFKSRGAKATKDLYMIRDTQPLALLVEVFFCDNKDDYSKANTTEKMQSLALKVVEGVINKKPENPFSGNTTTDTTTKPSEKTVYYRVVTGSYTDKVNAEKSVKELKEKGYNAFIDIFEK